MSEESTTPDLVGLTREFFTTATRQDIDALMGFYAYDAVWELAAGGMGTFEGVPAIRAFIEGWWATWEHHQHEVQEALSLGRGVVFAVVREDGQIVGSDGYVEQRAGWAFVWIDGKISRAMASLDIAEARAAAERLAEERA